MRIYLFGKGKLRFLSETIEMVKIENGKKVKYRIPFKNTKEMFLFGNFGLTYKSINKILENRCTIHFFTENGSYRGSLLPDGLNIFTKLFEGQFVAYLDYQKRLQLARWFILELKEVTLKIARIIEKNMYEKVFSIKIEANSIEELMGIESSIWKVIYDTLREMTPFFINRSYHPPKDPANATLSFAYSIIYSMITKKLWYSGLNPYIGFLHKVKSGRYSLSLDFSEIVKPIFVLTIFPKMVNEIYSKNMFSEFSDHVYLNGIGKRNVVSYIEKFFHSKIKFFEKPITIEHYLTNKIKFFRKMLEEVGKYVRYSSI